MAVVKLFTLLLSLLSLAYATVRPENISMCDYYTQVNFQSNTESNQHLLLQILTNTAIIGNYTTPNAGVKVNGFATPATVLGQNVQLLPYFDGGFASANVNGKAVAKNFLDDGGAAVLQLNKSSNGNTTSAQ
jgi:hypothetical protein